MNKKCLLNKQQVAAYLGLKIFTIDAWVSQRRIPHIKLGGRCVRFDADAIEAWLRKQTVEPAGISFQARNLDNPASMN